MKTKTVTDGRRWPGYAARFCPVCRRKVGTHREPTNAERGQAVIYHDHADTIGDRCLMAGKRAAIRAVLYTGRGR